MTKRIFGIILTLLGTAGLIFAAVKFVNGTEGSRATKELIIYGVLGAIFFFSGIGLVKNTHDRPR